jgi:protein gp37
LFPGAEPGVDIGGSEAPAGVQTDRAWEFARPGAAVDPVTAATKPGRQLIGGDEIAGCLRLHDYSLTCSVTLGNGRKMGTRAGRCLFSIRLRGLDGIATSSVRMAWTWPTYRHIRLTRRPTDEPAVLRPRPREPPAGRTISAASGSPAPREAHRVAHHRSPRRAGRHRSIPTGDRLRAVVGPFPKPTRSLLPSRPRMSQQSTIEWTDATWNPVRGCTKISPGCKHCYAETFAERFRGVPGHPYEQGFDLRLVPDKLLEPLDMRKPSMIFVNSMSDLFQEDVPDSYVELAFEVMLAADWHTYQVLTKRAQRMAELTKRFPFDLSKSPHIWLGVSVEDRKYGVPRIDHLRQARAGMRFLSVEPLLEDIGRLNLSGIDWLIVGGESGHGARAMEADWVRSLRTQCQEAKVAFFFKQWGGVRKKKAGRILDGCTWDEFPVREPKPTPDPEEVFQRRRLLELKVSQLLGTMDSSLLFPIKVIPVLGKQPAPLKAQSIPPMREHPTPMTEAKRNRILQLLADRVPKAEIALELGLSKAQVAAVAAHVTMGRYQLPPPAEESGDPRAHNPQAHNRSPTKAAPHDATRMDPRAAQSPSVSSHPGATVGVVDAGKSAGRSPELGSHSSQSVLLGCASDGTPVRWSPFPDDLTPNPHVLILGGSGSGKTYATVCLLAELAKRGIPSFVFDYGQGFTPSSLPKAFTDAIHPVEYDIAGLGISLNPLRITEGDIHGPVNVAQRFADSMQRVYKGIGIQQHAALREAILDAFTVVGITVENPSSWKQPPPSFAELRQTLQNQAEDSDYSNRRYVASVSAHIASLFVFNTFRPEGLHLSWEPDVKASHAPVSILQLRGLEPSLERAATELMLWDLWSHVVRRGPAKNTRLFVVLDEAHNLPMQPGSPVDKILREGRKFGLGLIVASQQPEDFPAVAFSNTATKLLFRIANDAATITKKLFPGTQKVEAQKLAETLQTLERGQAVVVGRGWPTAAVIEPLESRLTAEVADIGGADSRGLK